MDSSLSIPDKTPVLSVLFLLYLLRYCLRVSYILMMSILCKNTSCRADFKLFPSIFHEHKEEKNNLNYIINTAYRWYPDFANLLRLERLAKQIGLSAMDFAELIKGRVLNFTGRLFSSEHNRWFATDNTPLQILRDNDRRLTLTANRMPISQWFSEQYDKLRQSIRQPIQPKKSRGLKM